jgi:hypothetical protein
MFTLTAAHDVLAEPAHFWLSTSNTFTNGPEVPVIQGNGARQTVYVWARPETWLNGPYSTNNTFKWMQNITLNIVTTGDSVIDFLDDQITVFNPQSQRFQFVGDSHYDPAITSDELENDVLMGAPDGIHNMQGFTFNRDSYTGFGGTICSTTTLCARSSDGTPAWLIASVGFRALNAGTTNFRLQIGSYGMNHFYESTAATDVLFGSDTTFIYNAGNADHRNTTLTGDTSDLVLQAVAALPGDFNGDGTVNAADYIVWRKGLGTTFTQGDYEIWATHFGQSAMGVGAARAAAAPEPPGVALIAIAFAGFAIAHLRRTCAGQARCARVSGPRLIARVS